jgi:crotonobetainyl-CoA:carnitine CoA-transferase CaiB-like acyl-CoA transferase
MLSIAEFATRDARIANYDKIVAFLAPIFATKPREDWRQRLLECGVPHSAVLSSAEVLQSDQAQHLQMKVTAPHPKGGEWHSVRFPVSFDGERALDVTAPPILGADDAGILGRNG